MDRKWTRFESVAKPTAATPAVGRADQQFNRVRWPSPRPHRPCLLTDKQCERLRELFAPDAPVEVEATRGSASG